MTVEQDDRPDTAEPAPAPRSRDDDEAIPVTTLAGALGQLVAAVLVVTALIAVFIGGAVVLRWILG